MSSSRAIPTKKRRESSIAAAGAGEPSSFAELASSFAASFTDPVPVAQEVLARDLAELCESSEEEEEEPEERGRPRRGSEHHHAEHEGGESGGEEEPAEPSPYLYRRPSGIAFGTSRPALAPGPVEETPLSRVEKQQSRDAERSLLRDNHILPPKHPAEPRPSLLRHLYKVVFSTKVRRRPSEVEEGGTPAGIPARAPAPPILVLPEPSGPTETSPLLPGPSAAEPGAEEQPDDALVDEQWEAAVAAGQIKTTWQREAKTIAVYSRSLIVTFLLQYSINITSIFAVGHIGKLELGAVSLATMTANITFWAPVQGLATCLDTLCAQAFGSGHKTLVGLQLQRMACILVIVVLVPLACVWWNAAAILRALIPEPASAELAGRYLRVLILGMPAFICFECGKRFMQAQGLFVANTYVLLVAAPINVFLNWFLVWHLGLGFIGAPLAVMATQWLMPVLLFCYVRFVDGAQCWGGFSRRAFHNWGPMLRLALPGMIMVEAEYFAFEVLTLASGQFGTSELAAQSILVALTSTTYQIPFPMSIAASTRVANLIGARLPDAAKTCAKVAFVAGCLIGLFNMTLVASLRYQIPLLFTDDAEVIGLVARAMPVLAVMQVFDGLCAVSQGLLRGIGRQEIGGYANLAAYYAVALPVSFATAFGLGWKLAGLWFGVSIGLVLVAAVEFSFLYQYNWQHAVDDAERRNASG